MALHSGGVLKFAVCIVPETCGWYLGVARRAIRDGSESIAFAVAPLTCCSTCGYVFHSVAARSNSVIPSISWDIGILRK